MPFNCFVPAVCVHIVRNMGRVFPCHAHFLSGRALEEDGRQCERRRGESRFLLPINLFDISGGGSKGDRGTAREAK